MSLAVGSMLAVIILPVVGALAITLEDRERPWLLATGALSLTAVLTGALATIMILDGPATYRVAPGLAFRSDTLSVTIGLLDIVLTLGILAYTRTAGPHSERFYVAYLLFTTAVFGVVLSGDLVGTFLFLLLLIWATGRLVECTEKAGVASAARGYRRTATLGALLYLAGVVTAAWLAGSTNADRLGVRLATVGHTDSLVVTSFVLMSVGLALLVALIPLHGWLVETHARATDPVSALISGVLPAAAVYAFLRVLFDVFTIDFLAVNPGITSGIIYGALVSLLIGNLLAYAQRDIKGMLAYSTISQFGLVVAGLLVATETAVFGSVIQLFGHGIVKGAFCLVAGIIAIRFDARTIDEFGGLADRAPLVAGAFAGLAVAMIGLPPTVGFVGKWYIAVGALEQGLWIVAAFVVISTLLTLGYMIPFLDRVYFGTFDGTDHGPQTVTRAMVLAVVLAAVLSLAIGLGSVTFESLLREAIEQLVAAPVG